MVRERHIWDKSINHTSSNQVNCKINYINVNKNISSHTHNLHCKINTQQKFSNSTLLGVYHQIICGFGRN